MVLLLLNLTRAAQVGLVLARGVIVVPEHFASTVLYCLSLLPILLLPFPSPSGILPFVDSEHRSLIQRQALRLQQLWAQGRTLPKGCPPQILPSLILRKTCRSGAAMLLVGLTPSPRLPKRDLTGCTKRCSRRSRITCTIEDFRTRKSLS